MTLAIMFLAQLFAAVGFSIIFPFFPLYVNELGTNTGLSTELLSGLVFSAQGFTMMLASPFWGALADRYGRKLMVERAMFGGSIILLLMGFVTSAEQLVLLRAVQGLVTGTVAATNALVAAAAPRHRSGFAMGTVQVGLWSGVALGPFIGGTLSDAFGYRMPFYVTAGLLLFAGVLVWLGIKEEFAPTAEERKQGPGFIQAWKHIITADGVKLVYMLRFMAGLARTLVVPIAPLFVLSLLPEGSQPGTYTGMMVGAASATAIFSGVYLGRLGDRIGHRTVLIGSAAFAMLCYLPQAFVTAPWQLIGLRALAGIARGGIIAAPAALLARYTMRGEEGAAYGLDNSIVAGSKAISPLVGSMFAALFGLRVTFLVAAVLFMLIAVISIRWLPEASEVRQQHALTTS